MEGAVEGEWMDEAFFQGFFSIPIRQFDDTGDLFKQKLDIVGSWQQPPNIQFCELDAAK